MIKLIHCPQALGRDSWAQVARVLNTHFKQAGFLYKTLCPPAKHLSGLEPCDVLYTQAEFALDALRVSQAKVNILQRDSTHILVNQKMFDEENKRLGINWRVRSHEHIQKCLEEYQRSNYIVVLSKAVRDGFITEGVPAGKVRIITPGIDTRRFRPGLRSNDGVFRVRCAGTLGPRKGTVYLLQAWKKLALKNAELVFTGHKRIIGGRWVLEDIFRQYRSNSVKILPFLGSPQHESFYHRCDLHVLPSLEEGLATVTLEAMASELPQVVTKATGVTDTWTEECGRIVPVRNSDALASAIQFYYAHRDIGRAHGKVARRLVEKFTWERFGRAVVAFVRSVA